MPGNYAHYRFGAELLKSMPADVRRTVNRHRALYDVGLHGPDIFFYYNPALKTNVGSLGYKFHRQSGRDFFTRVCKRHRLEPSEPARAYLYGLLAHYCLDQVCHPFIHTHTDEGPIGHTELETEFDRFLLAADGKMPPHTHDRSRHITLSKGECVTVSGFFPPATPADIHRSVSHMAAILKFLASPRGPKRTALNAAISITGDKFSQFVMPPMANPNCAHLDEELMGLYQKALEAYPALAEQLTAHLTYNATLGEAFAAPFG